MLVAISGHAGCNERVAREKDRMRERERTR